MAFDLRRLNSSVSTLYNTERLGPMVIIILIIIIIIVVINISWPKLFYFLRGICIWVGYNDQFTVAVMVELVVVVVIVIDLRV